MNKKIRKRPKPTRGKRLIRNIVFIVVFCLIFAFFYPVNLTKHGAIDAGLENIHVTDADVMLIKQQAESKYNYRAFAGKDDHIFFSSINKGVVLYSNANIIDVIVNDESQAVSFKAEDIAWNYDDGGDTAKSFVASYDKSIVLAGFVNDERIKKVEVVTNSENSPFVTEEFNDGKFVIEFSSGKVIDSCSLDNASEFMGYPNSDYLAVNGYDGDGKLVWTYGSAEERYITIMKRTWSGGSKGEVSLQNKIIGYMNPSERWVHLDNGND